MGGPELGPRNPSRPVLNVFWHLDKPNASVRAVPRAARRTRCMRSYRPFLSTFDSSFPGGLDFIQGIDDGRPVIRIHIGLSRVAVKA